MVSEFEFIDNIKSKYGLSKVGDDCAVIPKDVMTDTVVTADLLIEEIDFRLEWATPEQIGHKALAVSLSDIAAMGAEPKWAMLSIGFPQDLWKTDFVDRFYEGWHALARKHGVELIGGDVSKSPDKLVIDSIVAGEVPKGKAILRSGATPGDGIYVSGTLGGASGGLRLVLSKKRDVSGASLVERQLQPTPQIDLGKELQHLGLVTSMLDLSDGLSSDLWHLCRASSVGARIHADKLPIDPVLAGSFPAKECLDLAVNGGEDFQLLFTSGGDVPIPGTTRIGVITDEPGRVEIVTEGDETDLLEPRGFRHF